MDLARAQAVLEEDHYGMEDVKKRVLVRPTACEGPHCPGQAALFVLTPPSGEPVSYHWGSRCPQWMSGRSLVYWVGAVVTRYAVGQAVEEGPLTLTPQLQPV